MRSKYGMTCTPYEAKVRTATSNEAWGASGAELAEIANATYDPYVHAAPSRRRVLMARSRRTARPSTTS